ncbi:MAG: PA14 domain-containing protein [Chloroflexia bacterium]
MAPAYGLYSLHLTGPAGTSLDVDGKRALENAPGAPGNVISQADVTLARGIHSFRLTGPLNKADDTITLTWAGAGSNTFPIAPNYLYNGPTGGLSGEIGAITPPDLLTATNPFGEQPISTVRSDPSLGFREATTSLGQEAVTARWQGTLQTPIDGTYRFDTQSNGPSAVYIDGTLVVNNPATGGPNQAEGHIDLKTGPHSVDIRYQWGGGPAELEWYWAPPGSGRALVPATVLTPRQRSWIAPSLPNPPPPPAPLQAYAAPPSALAPDANIALGDQISQPRGLAVDDQGNLYVGDRGHHKVAVFDKGGKLLRTFGKPAVATPVPGAEDKPLPGELIEITDVAVGAGGQVYVLDSASRVQIFANSGEFRAMISATQFGLYSPNGIGATPNGDLYIADTGRNRLLKLPGGDPTGPAIEFKGDAGPSDGKPQYAPLNQPLDVAVPARVPDVIYAIDLNNRIVQLDGQGTITAQWNIDVGREDGGSRLAASPDGARVYMSDPERKRVTVLDTATGVISFFGSQGTNPGQFSGPSGIAMGPGERVYVLDRSASTQVFTPTGGK